MVANRFPRNAPQKILATTILTATLLAPAAIADADAPTTHIAVTRATSNCDGWIVLAYVIEDLDLDQWTTHPDDGTPVTPQTHFIGNGAGPQGHWGDLPALSAGEGVIRVDMRGLPTHDRLLRVRRNGITSTPKPITECPPSNYIEK